MTSLEPQDPAVLSVSAALAITTTTADSPFSPSPPDSVPSTPVVDPQTLHLGSHASIAAYPSDLVHLFAIFDGHGEHGQTVALRSKELMLALMMELKQVLTAVPVDTQAVSDAVRKVFLSVDAAVLADDQVDTYMSGTTAVVVLCWPSENRMVVANVGDCRVVLGRQWVTRSDDGVKLSKMEAVALSTDHNCENEDEQKRLIDAGATLTSLMENGQPSGPKRIFKGTLPYPGMAVSRTIGDSCAKRLGVIAEPEIRWHELATNDVCMIIACDGVWDAMKNEDAVKYVLRRDGKPQEASQLLTQKSLLGLNKLQLDDNVSNICLFFRKLQSPQ